ncbi:MAG: nucleotide-binding protein [Chthoniobacterales bacterium]
MAGNPFDYFSAPGNEPAITAEMLESLLPAGSVTAPQPCILEKLEQTNAKIKEAVAAGRWQKSIQIQWITRVRLHLTAIYGSTSPLIFGLQNWIREVRHEPLTQEGFLAAIEQVDHLIGTFRITSGSRSVVTTSSKSLFPANSSVFLIHGHDELNLRRLADMVRDLDLNPVVLLEQPGQSATTIDKYEAHAQTCSFAIALFTADDLVTTKAGASYAQARPNVGFETGWFVGRIGKERVLILLQDDVRIHSDFDGVNRVQFRDNIGEKYREIQAEMKAAKLV